MDDPPNQLPLPYQFDDEPLQFRRCPDCAKAGQALTPLSAFDRIKAARYKDGYRYRAYCRFHQNIRTARLAREKRAAGVPPSENAVRARRNYAKSAKGRETARRSTRNFRKAHPEVMHAAYKNWVAKNPDKRKASQDRYRERERLKRLAMLQRRAAARTTVPPPPPAGPAPTPPAADPSTPPAADRPTPPAAPPA